jgi:hypothetical protein
MLLKKKHFLFYFKSKQGQRLHRLGSDFLYFSQHLLLKPLPIFFFLSFFLLIFYIAVVAAALVTVSV